MHLRDCAAARNTTVPGKRRQGTSTSSPLCKCAIGIKNVPSPKLFVKEGGQIYFNFLHKSPETQSVIKQFIYRTSGGSNLPANVRLSSQAYMLFISRTCLYWLEALFMFVFSVLHIIVLVPVMVVWGILLAGILLLNIGDVWWYALSVLFQSLTTFSFLIPDIHFCSLLW